MIFEDGSEDNMDDFIRELNRLFFVGWESVGIVDPGIVDIFEDEDVDSGDGCLDGIDGCE
jgi:hypothetical protein